MKAIQYEQHGGYEVLHLTDKPEPVRREGEVLIELKTAGVNPGDNIIRLGYFPGSRLPLVPGFEGMGIIADPGESSFEKGTRVMFTGLWGITEDGTWQERMSVPADQCVKVPDTMSDAEAGAFPIAFLTAYLSLQKSGPSSGKRILIPGVGGGVGNAAIQIAKAQGALQIITTAGSSAKAKKARELGYENVIDLSSEPLRDRVMALTDGKGVDVIIDGMGGDVTAAALSTLAGNGTHVVYGAISDAIAHINVFDLIMKGTRMVGVPALAAQRKEDIAQAYSELIRMAEQGKIKPVIAKAFPLEEAAEAQRHLAEARPFGKVVITLTRMQR